MEIRTETKKCRVENRVVEVAKINVGGERGNSGMYDPSFARMSRGLSAGVESKRCVPSSTEGPGTGGPSVRLFPTGKKPWVHAASWKPRTCWDMWQHCDWRRRNKDRGSACGAVPALRQ